MVHQVAIFVGGGENPARAGEDAQRKVNRFLQQSPDIEIISLTSSISIGHHYGDIWPAVLITITYRMPAEAVTA